jgi:hypothetical protein
MRRESYQQFAIVAADSAQLLTEQLNAKLKELRFKHPTVTFEGLIARIQYTENESVPEGLEDEYELRGVRLTCQDCPFYEPIYKANGELDGRVKYGNCPYTEYGRTYRDRGACETLFSKLNNGEVRLCLGTK